ncbi:hypothetical protein G6F22_016829 [Rhizopus arrhizus]|nr:hypothetical protein G6F22_016829 [Rhizopus arrhizus]
MHLPDQRRFDRAGRHGVDPDAIGRQLDRHNAGQGHPATLGRAIRGAPRIATYAGHGRDVDDGPAPPFPHPPGGLSRNDERTDQIHFQDAPQQGGVGVQERNIAPDAGGIHQTRYGTEVELQPLQRIHHLRLVRDIHPHAAQPFGRRQVTHIVQPFLGNIRHQYASPCVQQAARDCQPDPGRAARNQDCLLPHLHDPASSFIGVVVVLPLCCELRGSMHCRSG